MMNQKEEVYLQLKWTVFYVLILGFLGAVIAGIQILFFEQTDSGRYAVHSECVVWDEQCVRGCEDAQYDNPQNPPSCSGCCLDTKDVVDPLGKRISELAFRYAVISGSFGIVVGLTVAEEKKKKL